MSSLLDSRAAGVLLHPTSLPGPFGMGDLGASARRFVDWLTDAEVGVWQILPLVPPGAGWSPYATHASMAMSPWLIDPVELREEGLLDHGDLEAPRSHPDRVDYVAATRWKALRLRKATARLGAGHPLGAELHAMRERAPWAEEVALFEAIHAAQDHQPWWAWPAPLRDRDADALAAARRELAAEVEHHATVQMLVERQWRSLRAYAAEHRVRLLGDLPIYVESDSVDVWSAREQFDLQSGGRPREVAGVPPDYFSETGQLWGSPLYDWDRMAEDGYAWWVQRLRRALEQCDAVRIDHFRAFSAYWAVPAGAEDARGGRWVEGPGEAFFAAMKAAFGGDLPIIAEDLGTLDEAVHALRDAAGLPGMEVLQFAFGEGSANPYLPHHHRLRSVVYTGTHDNDTTRGFWESAPEAIRDHVRRYYATDGHDIVWTLIRSAMASVAALAVVPLQDVLDLDGGARMNTPGLGDGNWGWRVREAAFNVGVGARLRDLVAIYGRSAATCGNVASQSAITALP